MFKANRILNKIKNFAGGNEDAGTNAEQKDPRLAHINELLLLAEKKPGIRKVRNENPENPGGEINSLKKQIQIMSEAIGSRDNNSTLGHRIAAYSGTQKRISEEIEGIRKDIELLKASGRKTNEGMERDSKKFMSDGTSYKNLASKLTELSNKVSDLSREMSLDRAMYPASMTALKKEVDNLKVALEEREKKFSPAVREQGKNKKAGDFKESLQKGELQDIGISGPKEDLLSLEKGFEPFAYPKNEIGAKFMLSKKEAAPIRLHEEPKGTDSIELLKRLDEIKKSLYE